MSALFALLSGQLFYTRQIQTLQTVLDVKFSSTLKFDAFVPNLVVKHYGIAEVEQEANTLLGIIVTRIAVHDL